MTRDELIRIAIQCQLVNAGNRDGLYMDALAEFAKYVAAATLNSTWTQEHWTEYERGIAAAEREACAKLVDPNQHIVFKQSIKYALIDRAAAIRARGQA